MAAIHVNNFEFVESAQRETWWWDEVNTVGFQRRKATCTTFVLTYRPSSVLTVPQSRPSWAQSSPWRSLMLRVTHVTKKKQIGCFCFVSWFVSATTNILKLGKFISQKEHVWPNMWNWIGWFLPMAGSFRALYLSLRASGVKVRLRSSLPIIYQSSTQQWTWYNDLDKTHWQVLVIQVRG